MSCLHKCWPIKLQMWDTGEPKADWTKTSRNRSSPKMLLFAVAFTYNSEQAAYNSIITHWYCRFGPFGFELVRPSTSLPHAGPALNPPRLYCLPLPLGPPVAKSAPEHPEERAGLKMQQSRLSNRSRLRGLT